MFWWLVATIFVSNCYYAAPECRFPFPFPVLPETQSAESIYLEEYLSQVMYSVLRGTLYGCNRMDPLYLDTIPGQFATLQYIGCNNTLTGLKNSRITSIKVSEDIDMVAFKLDIPCFTLSGTTSFSGFILYLPSNGTGAYELDYGRYLLKVYVQLIQLNAPGGCKFLQFGNFSLNAVSISSSEFKLTHVVDKGVDVTEQRNRFMDENWQDVMYFIQDPVLNPAIQSFLGFCNEYLITIPMNYILNN